MTTTTSEPEPCPDCRGVAGRECPVCNGIGFKPYAPPKVVLDGGLVFHPGLIPDIEPPGLPKKA
jgi:hypothetical protein